MNTEISKTLSHWLHAPPTGRHVIVVAGIAAATLNVEKLAPIKVGRTQSSAPPSRDGG